jgi:hypothetical protein
VLRTECGKSSFRAQWLNGERERTSERNKHFSFGVLSLSSAIAMAALILLAVSGVASIDQSARTLTYAVGSVLFLVYMPIGLWGTVSLFRAYGASKN